MSVGLVFICQTPVLLGDCVVMQDFGPVHDMVHLLSAGQVLARQQTTFDRAEDLFHIMDDLLLPEVHL